MSGIAAMLGASGIPGGGLLVTASPGALFSGSSMGSRTTVPTTVTVFGGSGSYSYSWAILASDECVVTIGLPASASTTFGINGVARGAIGTGTARCTVTDTLTIASGFVDVPLSHTRFDVGTL